jgi:hypothetical protein
LFGIERFGRGRQRLKLALELLLAVERRDFRIVAVLWPSAQGSALLAALGELRADGCRFLDVHDQAERFNIAPLSAAAVRIVTTNFDQLFEGAIASAWSLLARGLRWALAVQRSLLGDHRDLALIPILDTDAMLSSLLGGQHGNPLRGEGLVGLTQGFLLRAGAGGVLVSLWPVDDRATNRPIPILDVDGPAPFTARPPSPGTRSEYDLRHLHGRRWVDLGIDRDALATRLPWTRVDGPQDAFEHHDVFAAGDWMLTLNADGFRYGAFGSFVESTRRKARRHNPGDAEPARGARGRPHDARRYHDRAHFYDLLRSLRVDAPIFLGRHATGPASCRSAVPGTDVVLRLGGEASRIDLTLTRGTDVVLRLGSEPARIDFSAPRGAVRWREPRPADAATTEDPLVDLVCKRLAPPAAFLDATGDTWLPTVTCSSSPRPRTAAGGEPALSPPAKDGGSATWPLDHSEPAGWDPLSERTKHLGTLFAVSFHGIEPAGLDLRTPNLHLTTHVETREHPPGPTLTLPSGMERSARSWWLGSAPDAPTGSIWAGAGCCAPVTVTTTHSLST